MKVRVLKDGVSQRPAPGKDPVPVRKGATIEVSEAAYAHLGPAGEGLVELIEERTAPKEGA
jgi:hypothetical protein